MKATMSVIGTLAMLISVCVINFDKDLALACALAGGFILSIENMIPSLPDKTEDEINKSEEIEHKFQSYDLMKRGQKT